VGSFSCHIGLRSSEEPAAVAWPEPPSGRPFPQRQPRETEREGRESADGAKPPGRPARAAVQRLLSGRLSRFGCDFMQQILER
jgi:hypothetical protein